jgi:hypothetical protein
MRKTALAAGGFALVLALSACGGSIGGNAAPAPGQDKAGKTSLFSDPLQLVAAAKAGTEKSKSSKFSMEANAAGQSIKGSGSGRYDGDNFAMTMTMNLAGETMEMVFVNKALYMKLPESQRAHMDSAKPWIKVSADGTDPMSKSLGPILNKAASDNDPSKTLDKITKAGKITNSEQVPLDGQPTSHYTIDLDFAKMLDEATGQIPGAAGDEVKNKLQGKDLHVPAELWLNSDQLPVQMVMDMSKVMSAAGAPAKGEAKTTVKYTDWGSAVDIHEPPADQVTDFGALMRGAKPTR